MKIIVFFISLGHATQLFLKFAYLKLILNNLSPELKCIDV